MLWEQDYQHSVVRITDKNFVTYKLTVKQKSQLM